MMKKKAAILLAVIIFFISIPVKAVEASNKKIDKFTLNLQDASGATVSKKVVLNTDFIIDPADSKDLKEIKFTIEGDFIKNIQQENIKRLRLVRERDGKTITVPAKEGDTTYLAQKEKEGKKVIEGEFTRAARKELSREIKDSSKDYPFMYTSAGIYKIYIDFSDGTMATGTEKMVVKDRPRIIQTDPRDGEHFVNPETYYRKFRNEDGTYDEGYYLRATFEDIGHTLELMKTSTNKPLPAGITVYIAGENVNFVDQTKQLRSSNSNTNELTVYIPLTEKLKDGQKYQVFFPEKTLVEYKDIETGGNRPYAWGFDTNYFPKTEKLYEGSIPEYYDYDYPIVIEGTMFTQRTTVRFQHTNGRAYYPYSVRERDDNTLYVYLPRYNRLPVGTYDIIVTNGYEYEVNMAHGAFSVVAEGDYVPNEAYRVKGEPSIGMVKEILGTSKDVIDMRSSYSNTSWLTIDLDELMGTEPWVREVQYSVRGYNRINVLHLVSKWAHATLSDVVLQGNVGNRDITLRVGRVAPTMIDAIKPKLPGRSIKSDFIEVAGDNFTFSSVTVDIPYFESDGSGLIALRYDEELRYFVEVDKVNYMINPLEGKVQIISRQPGIFVIIE